MFRNGFWTNLEALKEDDAEAGWEFLENELKTKTGETPYHFLHGSCNIFAQHLNETYGYRVEMLYEEPGQLIHAYCTYKSSSGKTYYIDVRGITDSFEELVQEFIDCGIWCGDMDYSWILKGKDTPEELQAQGWIGKRTLEAAKEIDEEYRFYDAKRVLDRFYAA